MTAVVKNRCRNAEKKGKARFNSAASVLEYNQAVADKKAADRCQKNGQNTPKPVKTDSSCSVQREVYYETKLGDLELKRSQTSGEVTAVKGVRSHYHYRFIKKGKLAMRWLACCCDACLAKEFSACVNAARVGGWREVDVDHSRLGVRADQQMYRQMSLQMHHGLEEGDIVAIYTHDDAVSRRKFWLGKVIGHQHSGVAPGPAGITCPTSGTKHPKGAAIISLQYYDFAGNGVRHDTQFVFGQDPSTYLVAASLLRCVLTERDTFAAPTRSAGRRTPTTARRVLTMQSAAYERIMRAITDDFKDLDE